MHIAPTMNTVRHRIFSRHPGLPILFLLVFLFVASCRAMIPSSHAVDGRPKPRDHHHLGLETHTPPGGDGHQCDLAMEMLEVFYNQDDFIHAITTAAQILQAPCTSSAKYQTYALLGDIYVRTGNPVDAILFYEKAAQLAPTSDQRAALMEKSLPAAIRLPARELIAVSTTIDSPDWRGDLLFKAGMLFLEKEKETDALSVLSGFCNDFPDDKRVVQVQARINSISPLADFDRHRIGVMLPLSGPYQNIGKRILKAIEMAVAGFNRQETGRNYRMVVKDTGADPEKAVLAVRSLEKEQVAGIIGPLVTAQAAATEANRLGIPMIVLTQKEDVTRIGEYIFRNFITPEMQAEALVSHLIDRMGIHRFAVMYPEESYGISFKNAFIDKLSLFGGDLRAAASYLPAETDFTMQITNLISGYRAVDDNGEKKVLDATDPRNEHGNYQAVVDFEALFIPDSAEAVSMIAPQLRFHDIGNVILVGTNIWSSEKLIALAGPYMQGAIYPIDFDIRNNNDKVRDFVSAYAATEDEPPGFIEAIGFDTASIMLRALSLPETASRKALKKSLHDLQDFDGITGISAFKPSGEPVMDLKLCRISGNRSLTISN